VTVETPADAAIDALHADIAATDLRPLWTQRGLLTPEPRPDAIPYRWDGAAVRALAARSGELITIDRGGDRRVLAFSNPGLAGTAWATPTLWAALQYLNPGETAPAHRHTAAALRFVIDGDGVWTTVDGDACTMHPGDLILTPAWRWHEHTSTSDRPMIWLDGLDLPLVHALDAMFFEPHPDGAAAIRGHDLSERLAATGRLRAGQEVATDASPLLVYRWDDTDRALTALLEAGDPVASLDFVNPTTGGPVLPTIGCAMHRIPSAASTTSHRRSASRVLYVHRGAGRTELEGSTLEWVAGDVLAMPSWALQRHVADETTDLFEITDAPVLRALHLYREETVEP
jgi:gentisate 1,2-dioxygenase